MGARIFKEEDVLLSDQRCQWSNFFKWILGGIGVAVFGHYLWLKTFLMAKRSIKKKDVGMQFVDGCSTVLYSLVRMFESTSKVSEGQIWSITDCICPSESCCIIWPSDKYQLTTIIPSQFSCFRVEGFISECKWIIFSLHFFFDPDLLSLFMRTIQ